MYSVHLCTTSDRELPPPDYGPGLTWDRLTEVLRREVSPQAAALFAEPVQDAARGRTQWHIEADVDAKPFSELSQPEQQALLQRLAERRASILKYAAQLDSAGSEAGMRLANALRSAVEVPDEAAHLWSLGGEPVLSAWGRRASSAALPAATIVTRKASPAADPALDATIVGKGRSSPIAIAAAPAYLRGNIPWWLLWLLFALLLATIFYYLIAACAIDLPLLRSLTYRCPARAGDLRQLEERNASLRDAIDAKERELALARANCSERRVEPEHRQTLAPPGADEARKRVEQAQGTHGPLDITLAWNGREDLDLHVYCPDGHIYHGARTACGGTLEIDRNANLAQAVDTPVEHVVWSTPPPPGQYRIEVQFYNRREQPQRGVPYTVIVRQGDRQQEFPGVATETQTPITVTTFQR